MTENNELENIQEEIPEQEIIPNPWDNAPENVYFYEKMYPERNLPEGAMVTRYAPSPTGYVHLGNLLSGFADMMYARQSKGSFYLRIEDTDQKRMVEGGIENIVEVLHDFDMIPNEGYSFGGDYGS